MTYKIPMHPWKMIVQDLFTRRKKDYFTTVDYYNNFWEVDLLMDTSQTVIEHTKAHFARYGIPDMVVTDDGPHSGLKSTSLLQLGNSPILHRHHTIAKVMAKPSWQLK